MKGSTFPLRGAYKIPLLKASSRQMLRSPLILMPSDVLFLSLPEVRKRLSVEELALLGHVRSFACQGLGLASFQCQGMAYKTDL